MTVPVSAIARWYDIFLPGQLRDFRILQEKGRPARLTVGPWTHTEVAWRDFESWPPAGYFPQRFHLAAGGALGSEPPAESEPDRYRYDPAAPTPAAGGVRMVKDSGRVDNTALEARPDVLTYTTGPLVEDLEVIGEVRAEIWFSSSLPHADVFVRLRDVDPVGRSWNVCDGLTSVDGADGDLPRRVDVRLWPTAYRFKRGHRIRVQVSSGAFPRFARNPGTGEVARHRHHSPGCRSGRVPRPETSLRNHSADQQGSTFRGQELSNGARVRRQVEHLRRLEDFRFWRRSPHRPGPHSTSICARWLPRRRERDRAGCCRWVRSGNAAHTDLRATFTAAPATRHARSARLCADSPRLRTPSSAATGTRSPDHAGASGPPTVRAEPPARPTVWSAMQCRSPRSARQ